MAGLDSFVSGFARGRQLKYAREDRNMAREEREEAKRAKGLTADLLFPGSSPGVGASAQPGQVPLARLAMAPVPSGARTGQSYGDKGEMYFGGGQGGAVFGSAGPQPMSALAGLTASPAGAGAPAPAVGMPMPAAGAPGAPMGVPGAGGGIDQARLRELARLNPQAALAIMERQKAQTIEQEQANRDRWGRYLGALDVIDDPQQQQQLWERLVGEIEATGQRVPDNLRQFSPQAYQVAIRMWGDYDEMLKRKELEFKSDFEKQKELRAAGKTSVTTNVGGGDKLFETLDKGQGEMFSELAKGGVEARSRISQIDRLEALLSRAGTGAGAAIKQIAGEFGIKTEGLDDIQAAQALINKLVPQQRPPGSGPMSDADLALFKQSLPRVINQPGGNKLVIETMRGIAEYEQQLGAIADQVANREISPKEGREAMKALPDPLAAYTKALSSLPADTTDLKKKYGLE